MYKRECNGNVEKVIAITDDLPKDVKRSQVTRPLKRYMKQLFQDSNSPISCSTTSHAVTQTFRQLITFAGLRIEI